MARPIGLLSAVEVSKVAKRKGAHHDGGGLYLRVDPPYACSWQYRYQLKGRSRWMGLGPYPLISLAEARERATAARRLRANGIDPIDLRDDLEKKARLEAARSQTFKQCAEAYITSHEAGWRNPKHRVQWKNTLAAYAYPVIGDLPVPSIDISLVMKILEPIWISKSETASRLRGRIEAVLDWAKALGYRDGENPARWSHLKMLLPAKSRVARVVHHAALPYNQIPTFMASLRTEHGNAAHAFEYLILTAARTSEVIHARWSEINIEDRLWIIPANRMKTGKEHRIPLSERAVAILGGIKPNPAEPNAYVFRGSKPGKPLSNMAFLMLLRRMGRNDLTAHGFRSTFRDWCTERTSFSSEVAELALAHAIGSKVEAAYRRGDLFEKRHELARLWAEYCMSNIADSAKVIPIHEVAS